jgi:hypothetical protein
MGLDVGCEPVEGLRRHVNLSSSTLCAVETLF